MAVAFPWPAAAVAEQAEPGFQPEQAAAEPELLSFSLYRLTVK